MPAVAEVQFKAQGSQQVVTAFNSVGSAAQTGATKIQQNSTAMKSMGQGMKSSVSGIAQATTAFATLSLSIVSTWRAYRDLTDAQIAVDKANLRVKKTQEAIKKTTAEIAALQKGAAKGGLEDQRRKIDLTKLTIAQTAAEKKYGKGSIQAADAALKLKEAQVAGAGSSEKLKAAQAKLGIQQEQLGVQQDVAGEAQERFNDTQQNFYLSIVPTAISSLGLLATAFKGLGSGLIGGLGPIGLILGGITLAIVAFQTNFLGFRDAVGGAVKWLQDRFGIWKQTLEDIFNLIRKGDWNGAFALIKDAAVKFWEDLKKSVPFFGEVEKLVEKIQHGNWKGAFLQIWKAATDAWETIKKNIPLFGDLEKWIKTMVEAIKNGDWASAAKGIQDAFNATLGKGIEWIFGKNWKAGLDAAIAKIQAEAAVNKRSVPIQILMEINAAIKNITGVDIGKWFTDHPITTKIPFFAGITMMVDDPAFRQSVISGAILVVQKVGEGITAVAGLLDPYIASFLKSLFSVDAWRTSILTEATTIANTGIAIVTAIGGAISTAAADPNLTAGAMGDAAAGLWQGISDWFTTSMPETTPVLQAIAQGFQDSIASVKSFFEGVGTSIWNALIEGIEVAVAPFDITGALRGALDKLIIKPKIDTTEIDKGTKQIQQKVSTVTNNIEKKPVIIKFSANTRMAEAKWNEFKHRIESQQIIARIGFGGSSNIKTGSQRGAYGGPKQHGYQSTVHRPTMFLAGEGGRPEDVTVRPRGSVQRGGSGGGGFNGTINVYVDGVLRPARYDMGARK
jgi:hypothetical protein